MFDFFERPGKKIKKAAKVLLVLMIIAVFLTAFILPVSPNANKLEAILLALLYFAVGILLSYLCALGLYAVGAHIDDTREILMLLRKSNLGKKGPAKLPDTADWPEKPEAEEKMPAPATPVSDDMGSWQCDCGAVNPKSVKTCACGRSVYEVLASRIGRGEM